MTGVDTGFFFSLREQNPVALKILEEEDIVISVLTRLELHRLSLRRGIEWDEFGTLLAHSAAVVELDAGAADEAVAISHGCGIPALDALILASLVRTGCRTIYTRDEHFLKFARKGVEIIRLQPSPAA